jgi:transcriptional regulator with XRE-family HTH domain
MNIIKRLRIEADLSQGEFGALFDTSASHISRIESGLKMPAHSLLQKVAARFGMALSDLATALAVPGADNSAPDYKMLYEECRVELRQLKLELTELKLKLHFRSQLVQQEHYIEN